MFWIKRKVLYLCTAKQKWNAQLGYGVMVTLQILVLSFLVRIQVAQHNTPIKPTKIASFSGFFIAFRPCANFFIIGIRVQFENSVVESVVVSKQEYQRVRFDTTLLYAYYYKIITSTPGFSFSWFCGSAICISVTLPLLLFICTTQGFRAFTFISSLSKVPGLKNTICRIPDFRLLTACISVSFRSIFRWRQEYVFIFPDGWFPVQRYMRKMRFGEIVRD